MMVPRRHYKKIGEKLSVVGLGTWAVRDEGRALDVIVEGVMEYGINTIDTAEIYGGGSAEALVGMVIKEVGRDEVFVTTKLPPNRFRSPEEALRAARASLNRLGVEEVDLLLIHWPDYTLGIDVMIKNLERIADEGLARFIGVSNFDKALLEEAVQATRKHEIVADQIHYSILARDAERESLIKYAEDNGLLIQAYRAIELGRVNYNDRIREAAERLGLTPVKLAIAYVINACRACMALVKTENKDHLKEIVEASTITLGEPTLSELRRI